MWDLQFEINELVGIAISLIYAKTECEIIQQKTTLEVIYDG